MRRLLTSTLVFAAAATAAPVVPREPFANAHVTMMARAQSHAGAEAKLLDVDVWAEGNRLRAKVRGEPGLGEFWVDGLDSAALQLVDGKVTEPKTRSAAHALQVSLGASPALSNANTDRIAGHPCKIVIQEAGAGLTLTRCIWRGLPLSIELKGRGFEFNAAATLVEEGAVTVADLQPPPGAPAAPASLSATR